MPNLPISGLTASASNAAATDVLPVVQTTGTGPVKMTVQQMAGGLLGSTTLSGATITADAPVLNLAQTWNASGVTFTGLRFNAAGSSDANSAAGSLLMDLQVGGASKFNVSKQYGTTLRGALGNYLSYSIFGVSDTQPRASLGDGGAVPALMFGPGGSTVVDVYFTRRGAANLRLGNADAAAPVAQTLSVQSGTAGASALSCSISGTTLTVGGAVTGTIAIGHAVTGTGVSAGTVITAGSGTTWTVNNSQTVSSTTMYFNSVGQNLTITGSQGSGPSAGGSIVFQVAPAGSAGTTAQNALATALTIASTTDVTFAANAVITGTFFLNTSLTGNDYFFGSNFYARSTVRLASGIPLGWSSSATAPNAAADLTLFRDAANTLALRNGANAQAFNLYRTFTDASNYQRVALYGSAGGNIVLEQQVAGTGVAGDFYIGNASGSSSVIIQTGAGIARWLWNSSGHFLANVDNTYDIGAPGANRPRSIYAATSIEAAPAAYIGWNGRAALYSDAANNIRLYGWGASIGLLQFGGTTSSFPALKRSSTTLQARLADDSAFASVQGKLTTDTAYTAGDPTTTGYLVVYDSTGTAYKIPAVAA